MVKKTVTEEKVKNSLLTVDLGKVKAELVDYQSGEKGHYAKKKKSFLESLEFFDLLGSWSIFLFEHGFEGAFQQFKEVGYPLEGTFFDFLYPYKIMNNILHEKFDWDSGRILPSYFCYSCRSKSVI